jgi:hypothetical protein
MGFGGIRVVHVLDGGATGTTVNTVGCAHDSSLGIVNGAVLISGVCLGVLVLTHGHGVVDGSSMTRVVLLLADRCCSSRRVVVDRIDVVNGYRRVTQVAGTVDGVRGDALGSRAGRLLGQGRATSALLVRGRTLEC